MKCKKCGEEFDYPDYVEFRTYHYKFPECTAGNSGTSWGIDGYTAVCPYCGQKIYHGDRHNHPNSLP